MMLCIRRSTSLPRRTVMVSQGFDKAIRELQAKLLLALERDVSYTEALNVVLYLGFLRADEQGQRLAFWKQDEQEITEGQTDALLDAFDFDKDRIRETLNMIGISGGPEAPGIETGGRGSDEASGEARSQP